MRLREALEAVAALSPEGIPAAEARGTIARSKRGAPTAWLDITAIPSETAVCSVVAPPLSSGGAGFSGARRCTQGRWRRATRGGEQQ